MEGGSKGSDQDKLEQSPRRNPFGAFSNPSSPRHEQVGSHLQQNSFHSRSLSRNDLENTNSNTLMENIFTRTPQKMRTLSANSSKSGSVFGGKSYDLPL